MISRLDHLKIVTKKLVESGEIRVHELHASNKNIINVDQSDTEAAKKQMEKSIEFSILD